MKKIILLSLLFFVFLNAESQWIQTVGQPGIPPGYGWTGAGIKSIAAIGTNIFASTQMGVYFSADGGQTWVSRSPGGESFLQWYVNEFATSGTDLYAGLTPPGFAFGVFKTSDLGVTWTSVNSRFESSSEPIHITIYQNDIFEGAGKGFTTGINKSGLTGINTNSWFSFSDGLYDSTINSLDKPGVSALTVNGSSLLAGIDPTAQNNIIPGIYISPVNAANWVITSGISATAVISSFCNNGPVVFAGNKAGTPVLYKSTDAGLHWTAASTNAFLNKPVFSLINNADTIYAGTSGNGVIISKDNGLTWAEFNDGFKDAGGNLVCGDINSFLIIGNTIYAATNNGVWKRPLFSAVPVSLLNFTVINRLNHACLNWQTATEINTDKFVIEHNKNAIRFEPIGTVTAAVNSSTLKNYSYTDITPGDGINYYRLKQVDRDGSFVYSKTVMVNFSKKLTVVYPNPASAVFTINNVDQLKSLEIINAEGMLVQRMKPSADNQYNISSLPNGMYSLKLLYNDHYEIIKLGKQ